ncbi:MAG: protein-S-isoprenylcysteine O-methyltransferase Ste14 [Pseudohongiellaceae bacterium]|jgi:protein-S-isoprenylcysteine O-methyltransferase Ste14
MNFLETKIPPPVVTILFGIAMWYTSTVTQAAQLSPGIRILGLSVFIALGSLCLLSGAALFRVAKTTVNPLKPEAASSLVTSGIYKLTRNPMYVGLALLLCAWAFYLDSLWATPFIPFFIGYIQRFQIAPEERALLQNFNDEFMAYKKAVRPWL